jgi:hypothetical protein
MISIFVKCCLLLHIIIEILIQVMDLLITISTNLSRTVFHNILVHRPQIFSKNSKTDEILTYSKVNEILVKLSYSSRGMDLNVFAKAIVDGDLQTVKAYIEEWKTTLEKDIIAKNVVRILIIFTSFMVSCNLLLCYCIE